MESVTQGWAALKKAAGKAAGASTPEAYPLGYVEDVDKPRTQPAVFFSAALEGGAEFKKDRARRLQTAEERIPLAGEDVPPHEGLPDVGHGVRE